MRPFLAGVGSVVRLQNTASLAVLVRPRPAVPPPENAGAIAPYRAWQSAARGVDRVPDCSDGVRVGPSNAALDLAHLDVADADRCGQLAQAHAGGCAPAADRRAGDAIRTGRLASACVSTERGGEPLDEIARSNHVPCAAAHAAVRLDV